MDKNHLRGAAMSVQRFDFYDYRREAHDEGDWMRYRDHAAEVARLRGALQLARSTIRVVYHRDKISEEAKNSLMDAERTIDTALAPAARKEPEHPDDLAVDQFAAVMKAKLAKQRAKGYGGWDTKDCPNGRLPMMLREHVEKGDPVDVANFAMMCHHRGEKTNAAARKETT